MYNFVINQFLVKFADAFLISELRHEIDTLKGQHAEYVVQLRHEREFLHASWSIDLIDS